MVSQTQYGLEVGMSVAGERSNSVEREQKLIVVIEDNQDINDLLSSILEEEGYRVISVTNGREAVEVARRNQPDLITLDLALPGKDGWAIARELQEDATTENIPILVISAYTRDLDVPLRRHVARVISKPFYITQVINEVEAILQRRASDQR